MALAYTILIFCIVVVAKEITCLKLKDLNVPSVVLIERDDAEPIKIGCDYELDSDSISLVIKWIKDDQVIYQWIRGYEPSAFPYFKDQVDEPLSAELEGDDKSTFLMKPSINATGTYKCIVQTSQLTLSKEKHLQVIDLRNFTLTLEAIRIQNETHLECKINNIYPAPTLTITSVDGKATPLISFASKPDEDGYFDATAVAVVRSDSEDDAYECATHFDGLAFNLTTTITSGCIPTQISVDMISLVLSIVVIFFFHFVR